MEGVLAAVLTWFVFKENFDRRIFLGVALIDAAGILLSWEQVSDRLFLYRMAPANFVNDVHIKHSRYLRLKHRIVTY